MTSGEARRLWRAAIKRAWGNKCAYCGATPIDDKSLTIDHVRAKSNGGEDTTSNCIPACPSCNADKGSLEWVGWFRKQDFYDAWTEVEIRHWLQTGDVLRQGTSLHERQIDALTGEPCGAILDEIWNGDEVGVLPVSD